MIDKNLIEKSLSLCWKEYSDMWIESYCYFLLSPEFLEKIDTSDNWSYAEEIWLSIASYQYWDEQPLINTLQKICHE